MKETCFIGALIAKYGSGTRSFLIPAPLRYSPCVFFYDHCLHCGRDARRAPPPQCGKLSKEPISCIFFNSILTCQESLQVKILAQDVRNLCSFPLHTKVDSIQRRTTENCPALNRFESVTFRREIEALAC